MRKQLITEIVARAMMTMAGDLKQAAEAEKDVDVAQADGTQVSTLTSNIGFIGRIHSVSAGTYYTMIRIQVLQNKDVA